MKNVKMKILHTYFQKKKGVLHVFVTSTDLCTFLVSVVVHFFQHLFSCEHGTHCISPSRLRHKSTLYIKHICCVLFLNKNVNK